MIKTSQLKLNIVLRVSTLSVSSSGTSEVIYEENVTYFRSSCSKYSYHNTFTIHLLMSTLSWVRGCGLIEPFLSAVIITLWPYTFWCLYCRSLWCWVLVAVGFCFMVLVLVIYCIAMASAMSFMLLWCGDNVDTNKCIVKVLC